VQWHDLRAFLAVADCGSFSRAAERLHISQPAVSKRVQALEQQLDRPLFDRVGRRIYLTAAGKLLRPRAEALLAELADTERELKNLSEAVAGRLPLATSHHVGLHRLAPALRAFTQRHPQARLDIRFEDSEAAHELVRQGRTELAVVTLDPRGTPDLDCRPVWLDPLCFVIAAEHPLALGRPVRLRELVDEPVILPGENTFTGRIVVELFAAQGLALTPALATNYLETIGMLVGAGLGWSVLPRSMVTGQLAVLSTDAPPLQRVLGMVTNPRRTLSNAALAFQSVLGEYADASLPT